MCETCGGDRFIENEDGQAAICPDCNGANGAAPANGAAAEITGKYFGADPTTTERESGTKQEIKNKGPLKPGSVGHRVLLVFADGLRRTAYDASMEECGDWHGSRRECTRLADDRKFLERDGLLPNRAPKGEPHVTAYRITETGLAELERLAWVKKVVDVMDRVI